MCRNKTFDLEHKHTHMTAIPSLMHMCKFPPMSSIHAQAHNLKKKVQIKQGFRNVRAGQRLAPDSLHAVGVMAPRVTSPKKGDNSIKSELDYVQSTSSPE